jgi:hypothetical protein
VIYEVLKIVLNSFVIPQNYQTLNYPIPNPNRSGVDKFRCFFYINPDMSLIDHALWVANTVQKEKNGNTIEFTKYTRTFTHKGASIFVAYNTAYDRCSLEFNPPHIHHGKSSKFLHSSQLVTVCEEVIDLIKQELHPVFDRVDQSTGEVSRDPNWTTEVHIKFIELGCPIEVKNELRPAFERAIEATRPSRKQTRTKQDDCLNGWTQKNSTKHEGEDKLYNKTEELRSQGIYEPTREGYTNYRYETTLKGKRRNKYGIRKLSHVTEETLWNTVADRFHACNWNVKLSSNADFNKSLLEMPYSQRERALGYLKLKEMGLESGLSVAKNRERKKLTRELGVVPGLSLANMPVKSHYLDLSIGEFVEVNDQAKKGDAFKA